MKKTIIIAGLFLCVFSVFAQVPQSFSYQAVARDNSGNILVEKQVSMKISILQGSASGSSVYSETHSSTTNQFGVINLEIGKGTSTDNFSKINWSTGQFFLKIEMDETAGSSYKAMGTSQLLSVPFALFALNDNRFDLNYPDGFANAVSITQAINKTTSYTVPAGKNFFIQNAQTSLKFDNDTFNLDYPPLMVAGPNQVITGLDNVGFISGFYVDAGVTPITLNLRKGSYTVPADKIFVLYAVSDKLPATFLIDGVNVNPKGNKDLVNNPFILTTGRVLSGNVVINGYLK